MQLVNDAKNIIDLTSINWFYKVGLNGELAKRLYDPNSQHGKVFAADKVPIGRPMTWYKVLYFINKLMLLKFFLFSLFLKRRSNDSKLILFVQTTFQAPLGTEPVVVDLQGMGKGHAWVNGNSIGRYWPSQIADVNGCTDICDYRGGYKADRCRTNCGNPSQRW